MVVNEEVMAQPSSHVKTPKPAAPKWMPSLAGWTKLNVDGSLFLDDESVGVGMIFHDQDGAIIFSACHSLRSSPDALHAKLVGCMEGLALDGTPNNFRV